MSEEWRCWLPVARLHPRQDVVMQSSEAICRRISRCTHGRSQSSVSRQHWRLQPRYHSTLAGRIFISRCH